MATKMLEVQEKIFDVLSSNNDLQNLVTGVFDYVPKTTKVPYITFGPMLSSSEDTKVEDGEKITITIEIWDESMGREKTIEIMTLIEEILEVELNLSSAFIFSQKITNREINEENYGLYHGIIDFQIILDWMN